MAKQNTTGEHQQQIWTHMRKNQTSNIFKGLILKVRGHAPQTPTPQFPASMYQLCSTYIVRGHACFSDPPDLMYHVGPVCEIRGHVTPVPVSVPPTSPYRSMVSEAAYHPAKSEPPGLPHLWVSTKYLHGWASSNIWQKQRQLRGRNIKHQCKCSLTANKTGLNQWTSLSDARIPRQKQKAQEKSECHASSKDFQSHSDGSQMGAN